MASGNESLELTEAGTWESFPNFAKKLVKQIGASIIKKLNGPDIRIWEIEYKGHILNLVYDDFPNGVSIEPKKSSDQSIIDELYQIFKNQSDEVGL